MSVLFGLAAIGINLHAGYFIEDPDNTLPRMHESQFKSYLNRDTCILHWTPWPPALDNRYGRNYPYAKCICLHHAIPLDGFRTTKANRRRAKSHYDVNFLPTKHMI